MTAAVDVVGVTMSNAMELNDHHYTVRLAQGQHGSPAPAHSYQKMVIPSNGAMIG